ncbi:hypothetical protein GTO89_01825 [Heliobacterium gestii]|uniref:Uncharacterized protein n=1 Tax=Heliomicrobium gestii TaxID=2699 RepID=A0A845LAT1_HELGE|nr:hypothetical protein [Heliomicrobium gestii]MBM7865517.1 hypothetical protein [Heliomicrobium gestii]MZP41769.1 hypothetical protein [Heliomicrobium gestii]
MPKTIVVLPALLSGFLFLCLLAALAWLGYGQLGGERSPLASQTAWQMVVTDRGEQLGACRWPWQQGEALIDTQGRRWQVEGRGKAESAPSGVPVHVRQDLATGDDRSDPVVHPALCPVGVLSPADGTKGSIALLVPGDDDSQAAVWQKALEQAGYRIFRTDDMAADSPRAIRQAAAGSPLAIVRLRQSPAGGWRGPTGERQQAQLLIEAGHPRQRSNLTFALRWQQSIQTAERPVIVITRRRLGQHLFPRAIDVLLPETFVPSESVVLARGLAAALEPDSLTNEGLSVIMDKRIMDIRGPQPCNLQAAR